MNCGATSTADPSSAGPSARPDGCGDGPGEIRPSRSCGAAVVVLVSAAGALSWAYWLASKAPGNAGGPVLSSSPGPADRQDDEPDYLEDMRHAQIAFNSGDAAKARDLLAKWQPGDAKATDHRAWEWHLLSAQCREQPFAVRGHSGQVQALAWGPDGERLASADRQGFVKVWRLAGGADKPLFETGPIDGGVGALAWSPDGKHLAAVCRGKVRLWDGRSYKEEPGLETDGDSLAASPMATGGDIVARQVLFDTWLASLTWSPDGSHLALFDAQGKVQIWDVPAGKRLLVGAQQGGVHTAAWSPHGNRLASVGGYGVVTVWDPPDYKGRNLTDAVDVKDIITQGAACGFALAWADDDHLSVLFRDWQIRTLDAKSGAEVSPRRTLSARDRFVGIGGKRSFSSRYVWAPGRKLLASVPAEGYLSLGGGDLKTWDAATGKALLSFASAWHVDRPALYRIGNIPRVAPRPGTRTAGGSLWATTRGASGPGTRPSGASPCARRPCRPFATPWPGAPAAAAFSPSQPSRTTTWWTRSGTPGRGAREKPQPGARPPPAPRGAAVSAPARRRRPPD